jgi:pseudouridine synthase
LTDLSPPVVAPWRRDYIRADGSWRPARPEGLARVLARAGDGARPRAEALVRSGRLAVDGKIETDPARAVSAANEVTLDGRPLAEAPRTYLMLHKPPGVECEARGGVICIGDLLPPLKIGLEPAGRMDARARGMLLLSNDIWWNSLVSESHRLERRYEVLVSGKVTELEIDVIQTGMNLPGVGLFKPERVGVREQSTDRTRLALTLKVGHTRQIRAVLTTLRHEVLAIVRSGLGPVDLGEVAQGHYRDLKPAEVRDLASLSKKG